MKQSFLNIAFILTSFVLFVSTLIFSDPSRFFIDPDEVDEFVIDPADFDPDDREAAILSKQSF